MWEYKHKDLISTGESMKTRMIALLLTMMAVMLLVTACSSGATTSTTAPTSSTSLDGASLFQQRCSACHALPTNARGTADQWKSVVEMMVARGAQLTPEEQTAVINYLATTYGK
jgi:mono/diheme cytochrome c family protein